MSSVLRPSHRRHPADLGTAAASGEKVASVEVDSVTAVVSPKDVVSVEVDSAVHMEALADAKRSSFRGYADRFRAKER